MTNESHIEKFAQAGREAGLAAASWVFDGNTSAAQYKAVLDGLANGDPMVLDELPFADLSGQHADSPTAESLAQDLLTEDELETYAHYEDDGDGESGPHLVRWYELDELITAYEDGFTEACHDELERVAREQLAVDIGDMPIGVRAYNFCKRNDVHTNHDLSALTVEDVNQWRTSSGYALGYEAFTQLARVQAELHQP